MAAAPSSFQNQIREELSCSICLELFTRPKVLPCQHTFCQECLRDHAEVRVPFQCPNCRLQIRLPPQGVASLPDNLIVANMCERFQQQATLSEEFPETKAQSQSGNRCSFHPTEVLSLYCKQCQVTLCVDCIEESHDGHPNIISLTKATKQRRSTVQALINEGENILESYCGFIRDLRETEKTLNEKKQQTDNAITQAYTALLAKVEQSHKDNLERIQSERDRVLADVNELSAACDEAKQKLEQERGDFIGQETNLTLVVGKYRGKAAPTPVQVQPALFQPTDTPGPALGHVTVQSLPSAPIPEAPAARGTGYGNQRQGEQQSQRVTFGGWGPGTGYFKVPRGVTVSEEGDIFVADKENQRIQVFTLQGTFVHKFPTVVSGEQKMYPHDVAMDGEGNLWVVGNMSSAGFSVQYNKQGGVLRKFDLLETGWDRGVAVDTRRNHILITQTMLGTDKLHLQGEVQVFSPEGTLVRTVGQQQGMKRPGYITVDLEGNILMPDGDNNCVFVYNENGQFLFQFGGEGSGEGELKKPRGICTDRAGNIIVADNGNGRVEMFDKTGRFINHIGSDMGLPWAVAMTTKGQLVMTDHKNNTVSIFHNY
ncbi:E3 ubiquitin-protein ligase TRIM32-like [Branchiostoma floridae x Branchiostoma belcheri]